MYEHLFRSARLYLPSSNELLIAVRTLEQLPCFCNNVTSVTTQLFLKKASTTIARLVIVANTIQEATSQLIVPYGMLRCPGNQMVQLGDFFFNHNGSGNHCNTQ